MKFGAYESITENFLPHKVQAQNNARLPSEISISVTELNSPIAASSIRAFVAAIADEVGGAYLMPNSAGRVFYFDSINNQFNGLSEIRPCGSAVRISKNQIFTTPVSTTSGNRSLIIYDTLRDRAIVVGLGSDVAELFPARVVFERAALGKDGKVYISTDRFGGLVYDPATDTAAALPFREGADDESYSGVTPLPDGRILFVNRRANRARIYDPAEQTYTYSQPIGDDATNRYLASSRLPNGDVVFIQNGSRRLGKYHISSGLFTDRDKGSGAQGYATAALSGDSWLVFAPSFSGKPVCVYDHIRDVLVDSSYVAPVNNCFYASCTLSDGRVLILPDQYDRAVVVATSARRHTSNETTHARSRYW
ncbi:hypothetical protein [Vreelandella populi]|uniref:SMP-30/Gluconolactonase/LRE-like region domain-containing protein n=1 Tax=Vreelandella populi TaxID=2498858 RepID=A0A433LG82_9GAMM|nr:hypothetical protein [Halomonas populi]RUR48785.1 hypothetical protein ELY37_02745 [Halomonas populi]